jgi:hypothetical protein
LLLIDEARYLGDSRIELRFNDGRAGVVDTRALVDGAPGTVFTPLRDEDFVRRFELQYGTLAWPGELDVAPEYLYFLAFREVSELQEQFADWGYLPQTAPV